MNIKISIESISECNEYEDNECNVYNLIVINLKIAQINTDNLLRDKPNHKSLVLG